MAFRSVLLMAVSLAASIGCRDEAQQGRQTPDTKVVIHTTDVDHRSPAVPAPGGITPTPLKSPGARAIGSTLFELLSSDRTGVEFQMTPPDIEKNVREVVHLNVNGGISTGDYDNDGLCDFYVTTPRGGNRLFRNVGDFRF